jgi:hypothetical protein
MRCQAINFIFFFLAMGWTAVTAQGVFPSTHDKFSEEKGSLKCRYISNFDAQNQPNEPNI